MGENLGMAGLSVTAGGPQTSNTNSISKKMGTLECIMGNNKMESKPYVQLNDLLNLLGQEGLIFPSSHTPQWSNGWTTFQDGGLANLLAPFLARSPFSSILNLVNAKERLIFINAK